MRTDVSALTLGKTGEHATEGDTLVASNMFRPPYRGLRRAPPRKSYKKKKKPQDSSTDERRRPNAPPKAFLMESTIYIPASRNSTDEILVIDDKQNDPAEPHEKKTLLNQGRLLGPLTGAVDGLRRQHCFQHSPTNQPDNRGSLTQDCPRPLDGCYQPVFAHQAINKVFQSRFRSSMLSSKVMVCSTCCAGGRIVSFPSIIFDKPVCHQSWKLLGPAIEAHVGK